MGLGDERFQHRRFGFQNLRSESFDVETDGGLTIGDRALVGIALPHDHAFQSERISDVAVIVAFNDDFECLHAPNLGCKPRAVKRAPRSYFNSAASFSPSATASLIFALPEVRFAGPSRKETALIEIVSPVISA